MEFRCRLATPSGDIREGVYPAENEVKLRQDLEGKGLHVLSLRRRGRFNWQRFTRPKRRRVSTHEFIIFNQELAALLKAGIPLVESLDILRQRVEHRLFKSVLDDVYTKVNSGSSLSEAFEAHGTIFPGVYTASLLAGEKSGSLEDVLRRYVSYAQIISAVKRKTLSALIYPAILLGISLLVIGIIILRVVPEFSDFYAGLGAELPLATRVIMKFSTILRSYFALILLGATAVAVIFLAWVNQPGRGVFLDRLLLKVPAAGSVASKLAMSQLSRTLATLLGGGIALVNGIDVVANSVGNRFFSQQLKAISKEVREGQALSTAMSTRDIFPSVAVKMVKVGESTGALQEMLNSVADFFDEEIETTLSRFMTLIEPLLLVIMGIVIAGLLLALYMPLLQLGAVVQ